MNKRPLELAKPQLKILLTIVVGLLPLDSGKSDTFTREEQALVDRGAVMEMYKPDEHSRHFIAHIDSATDPKTGETRKIPKKSQAVVCFVFGIEDARSAREQGRSMAECHYSPAQAHEFLFAQGWDKYHGRFFTRCYVQEGEDAYDKAAKAPSSIQPTTRQLVDVGS